MHLPRHSQNYHAIDHPHYQLVLNYNVSVPLVGSFWGAGLNRILALWFSVPDFRKHSTFQKHRTDGIQSCHEAPINRRYQDAFKDHWRLLVAGMCTIQS